MFTKTPWPGYVPVAVSLGLGLGLAAGLATAQLSPPTEGTKVNLNGREYVMAWSQGVNPQGQPTFGISDAGLANRFGFNLLSTSNPQVQPVEWFNGSSQALTVRWSPNGMFRYLDISAIAQQQAWQVQPQGDTLQIKTPPAQVLGFRQGQQPWGTRWVIDVSRPTPWQISRLTNSRTGLTPREFALTVEASQVASEPIPNIKVTTAPTRTIWETSLSGTTRPQVSMLVNPPRIVVDFRNDPPPPRTIQWAPGLAWQEETISLRSGQFPLNSLILDPKQPNLSLRPIWPSPNTLIGIQPLPELAQRWQVAGAINGGFFNRDKQMPLGAIRSQGQWISGPILNRGAIGWTEQGQIKVGRLALRQTLTTATGAKVNVTDLNSGFLQPGLALYTPAWGPRYSAQTSNETIFTVQNKQISNRQVAGGQAWVIPTDGYLLVWRGTGPLPETLTPGQTVELQTTPLPSDFDAFPNILGAGPLLIDGGKIVLDAAIEQFGRGLDAQSAPRSAIIQMPDGKIRLVTTHNRLGGSGPTLPEWAAILLQLGATQALNLDGGSSTNLYLGGRLIDRHSVTTTRVANGIGIFFKPPQNLSN
ncbi:phosphodiester glycosidase family protein [Synechococcus sp. PCC 6312]|uniref:phosphodiester glycosidase family protein n=1 Tax=Synechococcus sp. (strain ATCC 27167 / PCC 6312) TaxID=195253 RepID=UPI00029F28EA|nr:phosphodiester glycosidase family protein [Synechococcus sp. PCC 6312]AFY60997.1 putative periplasmic protein (DUF2233) [Synechococcus sp. PCC 6312]